MTASLIHSGVSDQHQSSSSVPYADTMLQVARQGYSFQTREVLQRVVMGEQARIKEEQMVWRVTGSLVGMLFGLGDGLQMTDLFMGMAGASVASLAHEAMSHEDRQFLERCQSLWLVGGNSPVELAQRLGPARSRILLFNPSWPEPMVFNHHQSHRGNHLVPLGLAGRQAAGFAHHQSLEVLHRHFSADELQTLEGQLYPMASHAFAFDTVSPISQVEALELDPSAPSFLSQSRPVRIEAATDAAIGYQVPIPAHSDF
jgi:hypothetical protein